MSEVEELIVKAQAQPTNWKLHKEVLKSIRGARIRRSDVVVNLGEKLIASHTWVLGSEGIITVYFGSLIVWSHLLF